MQFLVELSATVEHNTQNLWSETPEYTVLVENLDRREYRQF